MAAVFSNGVWEVNLPGIGWIVVGDKLSNVFVELAARGYAF